MAIMRMKASKFGAPAGVYLGRFLGVSTMKDDGKQRLGRDGRPMEPGLEWQFQIVGGDYDGQQVGRITAAVPTTKNSCGTLLSGLVGRTIRPDEDVDPDPYKGETYQIVVSSSKDDPERTYVTQIVRQAGSGPRARPAAASAAPSPPPAPAPRPAPAPPGAATGGREWWGDFGQGTQRVFEHQVLERLAMLSTVEERDEVLVMPIDQSGPWKPAREYGLVANVPF